MKHLLCIAALVLCSSEYAIAQKQTIADIARRERASRQAPQKTATVTNATLNPNAPVAVGETAEPVAKSSEGGPASEPGAVPPPAQADTRDENYWRQQFDRARTEIRRAVNQVSVAELDVNSANRDLLTRSYDPDGRGLKAVADATKRLEDANKSVADARGALTQLEEEFRRAGAPAGWSR